MQVLYFAADWVHKGTGLLSTKEPLLFCQANVQCFRAFIKKHRQCIFIHFDYLSFSQQKNASKNPASECFYFLMSTVTGTDRGLTPQEGSSHDYTKHHFL